MGYAALVIAGPAAGYALRISGPTDKPVVTTVDDPTVSGFIFRPPATTTDQVPL
jgi:hypothetical protein